MSAALILLLVLFIGFLFSQFGGRLAARSSTVWWPVLLFVLFVAIWPEKLQPISDLLGIQLVSNFVLAALILFLMFQAVQQSAQSTLQARRLRSMVSSLAAGMFSARGRRNEKGERKSKRTLVIVPCYNEEQSLQMIAPRLRKLVDDGEGAYDLCIVNDGSLDGSERILKEVFPYEHVSHTVNTGVSGALLTGFKIAVRDAYDYAVQCDADGQHPIEAIPMIVGAAEQNGSDLLLGSRFRSGSKLFHESTTLSRRLGSLLIISVLQIFRRVRGVSDPTSGFRVYSQRACRILIESMPDDYPEPEAIAILALRGGQVSEVPVEMAPRAAGVSSLSGLKGLPFMIKVITALIGLRLRSLARDRSVSIGDLP